MLERLECPVRAPKREEGEREAKAATEALLPSRHQQIVIPEKLFCESCGKVTRTLVLAALHVLDRHQLDHLLVTLLLFFFFCELVAHLRVSSRTGACVLGDRRESLRLRQRRCLPRCIDLLPLEQRAPLGLLLGLLARLFERSSF